MKDPIKEALKEFLEDPITGPLKESFEEFGALGRSFAKPRPRPSGSHRRRSALEPRRPEKSKGQPCFTRFWALGF